MKIFKLIEVDIAAERARIAKAKFTPRQRAALTKLVDLFEAGKWQECLDHVNDKKAFGYDEKQECDEREYIGIEIGDVLRDVAYANYYTQEELLRQAKEAIK